MHRGVPPERHGITTNTFAPLVRPVPSLFDHAKANGLKTAFFFNWAQLRDLAEPDSIDTSVLLNNTHRVTCDAEVADSAIKHLTAEPADIIFLYFGGTDSRGHEHSWMSDPYIEAIGEADRCLGLVLDAVSKHDPTLLVMSDHGGHDRTHGQDIPEDMTIPFIASGPGISQGTIEDQVIIYDAAPTVAHLVGMEPHPIWEGEVRVSNR
jgi:phosphopentomutase